MATHRCTDCHKSFKTSSAFENHALACITTSNGGKESSLEEMLAAYNKKRNNK